MIVCIFTLFNFSFFIYILTYLLTYLLTNMVEQVFSAHDSLWWNPTIQNGWWTRNRNLGWLCNYYQLPTHWFVFFLWKKHNKKKAETCLQCHCALPQFVCLEGLVTSISDMFPSVFLIGQRRKLLLLFICVVCFCGGLTMVTEVRPI